jgi:NTP pyrophosphatase (non-canonical NTP hydrolase)
MKELLDAIDAAIITAEPAETGVAIAPRMPVVTVRLDLWERICIERSKIEPDAPETFASHKPDAETFAFVERMAAEENASVWQLGIEGREALRAVLVAAKRPNVFEDVRAFLAIGHPHMLPPEPGVPPFDVEQLCWRLIQEELEELSEGRTLQDLVQIADAVQDLIWVVVCLGFAYGLPMQQLWSEVARTNMAKFPGGVVTRRPSDNKIMKPDGWQPPRIGEILAAAFLTTPLPEPVAPENLE